MSQMLPTYLVDQQNTPIDKSNPLAVTVTGGGGGTSDQGKSNGDATDGWSMRLTDGAAFIVPAKTGQLPAALGATTAAGSVSVGLATDQLATLASSAKQDTGNTSLSSIDGKVATAANQTTANTALSSIDTKLSGQATAAKQDTGNASLASIDTKLTAPLSVTVNSPATVVGAAASGAATAGNPVLIGGLDTTNTRTIRTDTSGNLSIVGGGTAGSAVSTRPLQIGGSDGTNLQTIAVDTAGRIVTAPAKNAQLINSVSVTTLKSGAGVFRGFVIQNASSGGTGGLYIYDNTAASGTAFVGMFTTQPLVVNGLNIPFSTGLTVQITTAACPILFMWD